MGKRIKDISIAEQVGFVDTLRVLVDKLDADEGLPWLQAKSMQLKYLGNAYFVGSDNNDNFHPNIVASDSYIRFSTDGGTNWIDLSTKNVREDINLYFTPARVLATDGVQDAVDDSHTHTNKTLLDSLIASGDGDSFLADDGTYFNVLGGLTEDTIPIKGATGFENSLITSDGTSVDIDGTLTHTTATLDTESALLGDITGGSRVGKFSSIIPTNLTDNYIPYHVSDTVGLSDSNIFKDGTSIKIGDETNNVEFQADGTIKLNGTATTFDDITFDAMNIKGTGPGISVNTTELTVDFTSTADDADFLYVNVQLPHARKLISKIYPHIHWNQAQNAVPNFAIEYRWQVNLEDKTTAWTPLKMNIPIGTYVNGTKNQICGTDNGISPPTGDKISDVIQFKIYRDTQNDLGLSYTADLYTGAVSVMQFDCHIEKDSNGSKEEYVK